MAAMKCTALVVAATLLLLHCSAAGASHHHHARRLANSKKTNSSSCNAFDPASPSWTTIYTGYPQRNRSTNVGYTCQRPFALCAFAHCIAIPGLLCCFVFCVRSDKFLVV